ncbi:GNAT family N-acetyltransferase [Brachybacterium sp. AOP43-C2-M15]|uniref:GNAT family N-acetyltransferase n=1 Tax=Brachybacterium sp. AOP43-C2-M15 TaxID=3457661 RepID=UPI0040332940
MTVEIRRTRAGDEESWLRCRALSFLGTCYYDDVWTGRPVSPAVQLVAVDAELVVGILDVEIEGDLATIDTVAVHPDHGNRGIASALLSRALSELGEEVTTLDAWTREDEPALRWYRRHGFTESDHYLHVYKSWRDPADGWASPAPLTAPVTAFCHADRRDEAELRARYERVYVCRRVSRPVTSR